MSTPTVMVEFQAFEKRFGKVTAVKPTSFSIEKGETFALLGPNGSGKSTMIRSIVGLIKPTSGKILIEGHDCSRENLQVRKNLSYMPQRVNMPEQLTGREILHFFASIRGVDKEKIDDVLETVELQADADRFTGEYSGGMLQRLGLAVALLEKTALLLLDEPTLNLDPIGVERFRKKIVELKNDGVTIIFSSHILQDAIQLADRVGTIINGELTRIESVSEFRERITNEISVKVVLDKTSDTVIAAAIEAGALSPSWNGNFIQFKASPGHRLNIIKAIEKAGGEIREFHTEIPEWEAMIKVEQKKGKSDDQE
jgi:ABC-type multidrug transport system ATPase subunit